MSQFTASSAQTQSTLQSATASKAKTDGKSLCWKRLSDIDPKSAIVETLRTVHGDGATVEIRAIGRNGRKGVSAGYFRDYDMAATEALRLENVASGVYFTLNRIHDGCFARAPNVILDNPPVTTSDRDVIRRRWVLIDIDPVRPTGISATDDEIEAATRVAQNVFALLPAGSRVVVAFSGNGWHILTNSILTRWDVLTGQDVPTDPSDAEVKSFLQAISSWAGSPDASIDLSVTNLSRITKLYGTIARKGFEIADRPHRRSGIVTVFDV